MNDLHYLCDRVRVPAWHRHLHQTKQVQPGCVSFSFLFCSRLQHASRILDVFIIGTRDRSGVMGVSHGESRGKLRSSSGQIIVGITMMICPLHLTVWGALRIHRSLTTHHSHPGLPCDPLSGLSSSISCPSSATTNHRPLCHSGLPA